MKKLRLKQITLALASGAVIAAPIAATVSCGSQSVFFQGRRTFVEYTPEASYAGEGTRAWDMSVQPSNMLSRSIFDMATTTLIRQRVSQSSKVEEDKAGNVKETRKKVEEWQMDGADTFSVSSDGNTYGTAHKDAVSAMKDIETNGVKAFKFTVPKGVYYVNNNGDATKYEYKAIDFFYGFMRTLYTVKSVREDGDIKGVPTNAPKVSAEYLKKMKADYEWYPDGKLDATNFENGNAYLLNLFGVDIKATIEANTGSAHSDDEFIIKLKAQVKNSAFVEAVLGSSNIVTPVSSQKIRELNGFNKDAGFDKPGEFLQLLEFGKAKRTNDVADLSGLLTVGKYYFKQYDTRSVKNGGTGVIMLKNMHGANKDYVKDDSTLLKYVNLVFGSGDEDTFAQARQKSFLADNSESILYASVKDKPTLMQPIKNYKYTKQFLSSKTGPVSQGLMNPYYMINGAQKLDDNTSKLLFGVPVAEANNSKTADDEYLFGRGREFRMLLNTSANLFTLSKISSPASTKVKTSRDFEPNQVIAAGGGTTGNTFGEDPSMGASVNSITDAVASSWYANHKSDTDIALQPDSSRIQKIKNEWKRFLSDARTKLGLSDDAKFVFPLYDFRANDVTESGPLIKAFAAIVSYLNKITDGDNITFVEFDKASGDKTTNIINQFKSAPFVYSGAGADYPSVASLLQQFVSASYGYTIGAQLLLKTFDDPSATEDLPDLYGSGTPSTVDLSGIWTYIKKDSTDSPILKSTDAKAKLEGITLQDWVDYRTNKATGETKALLDEIDNTMQKYFLSIAGDSAEIKKWTQFISNVNMGDKLAMGYTSYSSSATPITGALPVGTSYAQPWIHLAQIPSSSDVQANYVDMKIDKE